MNHLVNNYSNLFEINDYFFKYYELIKKSKRDTKDLLIYEIHHIIPKSLGGINDKSNLVNLSISDHILAHYYLSKCIKDENNKRKMYIAFWLMIHNKSGYKLTPQQIEESKIEYRKIQTGRKLSEETKEKMRGPRPSLQGENNPNWGGKTITEKTLKKHSENGKKRKWTESQREKFSKSMTGKKRPPKSEESKKKTSQTLKNKPDLECPYCGKISNNRGAMLGFHFDFCKLAPNGSKLRKERYEKTHKILICPHCKYESRNASNMKKYHFNNCKNKEL